MNAQLWSWILTAVGLAGFFLAGKKIWWAWYVNIANQGVWLTYSLITKQWGFLVGVVAYTIIFTRNAIRWTKEERDRKNRIFDEEVRRHQEHVAVMQEYSAKDVELTKALYEQYKDIPPDMWRMPYRMDELHLDDNLDSAIEDLDKDSRG